MPIFCQQNVYSLKNTLFSCPYFVQKTSILSKKTVLSSHFFQLLHVKPNAVMPIFGQNNVNSCTTTLYYGPKKSIGCPLFSIFHEKINALMLLFCQKNVHSLKKTLLLRPYFSKKGTSTISKTLCSHVIFFKFFMKIPLLSDPYLFKKT